MKLSLYSGARALSAVKHAVIAATISLSTTVAEPFQHKGNGTGSIVTIAKTTKASGSSATLSLVPITITEQPRNERPRAGWTVSFSVSAAGADLRFQWSKDGIDLPLATNSIHLVHNVQKSDEGVYSVLITSPYGSLASAPARLSLLATNTPVVPGQVVGWRSIQPPFLTDVISIAASTGYGLALKSDGTVVGWGNNASRQLSIPDGLRNVVAIAANGYMECGAEGCWPVGRSVALKSDGTVVAWGYNTPSDLGLTGIVAISADMGHVLGLKSNGTVAAWGDLPPAGLTNVVAVAAGLYNLALKENGTVWTWGQNGSRETGWTNVIAIAAGPTHSLAVKSDGTIYGLGDVEIPSWSDVIAIAVGFNSSLGLKANGTVVSWGDIPAPPEGLSKVIAISADEYQGLAIVENPPAIQTQLRDGKILLRWPLSEPGLTLQSTTDLADIISWTTAPVAPVPVDSYFQLEEVLAEPAKFYRLMR